MTESHLRQGALDPRLLDTPAAPGHGGEVVFVGRVRNIHDGRVVRSIRYHAHPPLAEARLTEIEAEACRRFGVACRVAHAVGRLEIGDASVAVVIQGGHRTECFDACRWAIDAVKCSVPIWKEEHFADGSVEFQAGTPLQGIADR